MFVGETFADAYAQARVQLLDAPVIAPRGLQTKELTHVQFCIMNPRAKLGWHEARRFNLPFAVSEAVMLFAADDHVRYVDTFNHTMRQFSDDGDVLYGSYGPRIAQSLDAVVARLKADPDTRQAVIVVERPADFVTITKDVPCTIALQFAIRDGALTMHTLMRSNDLFWGFQYDVFNFTVFQEAIANTLAVPVGPYFHTALSLHVYARHFAMLDAIAAYEPIAMSHTATVNEMRETAAWWMFYVDTQTTSHAPKNDIACVLDAAYRHMHKNTAGPVPAWAQEFMKYAQKTPGASSEINAAKA